MAHKGVILATALIAALAGDSYHEMVRPAYVPETEEQKERRFQLVQERIDKAQAKRDRKKLRNLRR